MITKIHNIRGVGRFRDFAANPPIELGKLNLIYSENGQGKSTLSDILRSAAEGDHTRLLVERQLAPKINSSNLRLMRALPAFTRAVGTSRSVIF